MKEIRLTQGRIALVDDEDFEYLNQWKWCAFKHGYTYYACRWLKGENKNISMHRQILGLNSLQLADHKNGNGLDNQRHNLRIATKSQNCANRKSAKNSTSKYLGVYWNEHAKKWRAQLTHNYVVKYLGYFKNEEDAALAYNNAAKQYHREFSNFNSLE